MTVLVWRTAAQHLQDRDEQIGCNTLPEASVNGTDYTCYDLDYNGSYKFSRILDCSRDSDLLEKITGPIHTVTNTYELNRDVLASK